MPAPKDTLTVDWRDDGTVLMIDQRRLPAEFVVLELRDCEELGECIRTMAVRGAPAIGVAAALGMALAARELASASESDFWSGLRQAKDRLAGTRPTAVNLFWALDRVMRVAEGAREQGPAGVAAAILAQAQAMIHEDIAINRRMGENGAALLPRSGNILTHCNTGSLATVYHGTALGVIRSAVEGGKQLHVWVDETRPRLQGLKLTAWECRELGIPATVIVDGVAASLMRAGKVDVAIVGADRIAANGDTANKIGTYAVAVLAKEHGVPFYVAAPLSTIDPSLASGDLIPIEERADEELTEANGVRLAPEGIRVYNPAFDVTPAEYVTAIITEAGVAQPPTTESLAHLLATSA